MKLLLYCTKAKPYLKKTKRFDLEDDKQFYYNENTNVLETEIFNGKIVAECDFEVEKIEFWSDEINISYGVEYRACLTTEQILSYLGYDNDYKGYAIHIKKLHIFDKPKELSDYKYLRKTFFGPLGNAPQNMMYAYELNEYELIKKVLISIQPQWLCKILNGEKTIEVRKKVLKEML